MHTNWHFLVGAMALLTLITATPALAEETSNPTPPPVESHSAPVQPVPPAPPESPVPPTFDQPAPGQPPGMFGPDNRGTFHPPEDFKQRDPEKPFENFQPKEGEKFFDNRMNQPMNQPFGDGNMPNSQMPGGQGKMGQPNQQGNMPPDSDKMAEQQNRQMVQNAQHQIKGLEQGMRQFEKQLQMLTKQGIAVPADITETLTKIKSILAAVKAAKTADELTAAGWENLHDEMDSLREKQELLQQLSRWPQTLKQANRMLTMYTRQLTKIKTTVDRLRAKGIDMSAFYTEIETNINALKAARDEAVASVAAGKAEEAFTILEDKFFGNDQEIMEKQRIIQTMTNISRFPTDYKRGKKELDGMMTKMKRKKIDLTEIQPLYTTITTKADEVLQLIRVAKPDPEAIMDALQDLEDARQDFMEAAQSALGESEEMPWEQKQPAGTRLSFAVPKLAKPAAATMLALQ